MTPINPLVEALFHRLSNPDRESFENLAGILQFEVGRPRELAECLALLNVVRDSPLAVSGLVAASRTERGRTLHALSRHDGVSPQDQPFNLSRLVGEWGGIALLVPYDTSGG